MQNKIFDDFTNQYAVTKTLRFELKPVGETAALLEKSKVFETDEKIAKSYDEAKIWFDKLHREFIDTVLYEAELPLDLFEEFEKQFLVWKSDKNKKNKDQLEKTAKELRSAIVKRFHAKAQEWRDMYLSELKLEDKKERKKREKFEKFNGLDLLFKVEVFDFLKWKFPEAKVDGQSIFSPFTRFGGYFDKFHATRKNFYEDNGISTAIPTRIINDNFVKFLENKQIFEEKYKGKYDNFFSSDEAKVFELDFFNSCFTQSQIDKYNDIIAALKSKINKFRQDNSSIEKTKLPFFKVLFKQILGQSNKHATEQDNFIEIVDNKNVFPVLQDFIKENKQYVPQAKALFDRFIKSQKMKNDEFEIENIYVAERFLNTISNKWFASWNTLQHILIDELKIKGDKKKLPEFISIKILKTALNKAEANIDVADLFRDEYKDIDSKNFYGNFIGIWEREFDKAIKAFDLETVVIEDLIRKYNEYQPEIKGRLKNGKEGKLHNEKILDYANSALSIYQMMKYFSLEIGKEREWNPAGLSEDQIGDFYGEFRSYYDHINTWKYFNEFRNFLTKKPYKVDKFKVNFNNAELADGWDRNKEKSNSCVLLRRNQKYFLAVMPEGKNKTFEDESRKMMVECLADGYYEKMDYKYFPEVSKMIPKCSTQLKEAKKHFQHSLGPFVAEKGITLKKDSKIIEPLTIDKHIYDLNNYEYRRSYLEKVKTNEVCFDINNRVAADPKNNSQVKLFQKDFYKITGNYEVYRTALNSWIDFCKDFLRCYESAKEFDYSELRKTEDYVSLDEFYGECNRMSYKKEFSRKISKKYIDEKIANEELYLFQIYNKDFELDESITSEGYVFKGGKTENLHTMYWKALFSPKNLESTVLKLNGQAEIFFRKKSVQEKNEIKTKDKELLLNQNGHKGDRAYQFNRYTEDKILFHCPITLNFAETDESINEKLRDKILADNSKKINVIGIDRGEKHLAYYSVVNQKGDILEIGSFNKIKERADKPATDYQQKLDKLEKDRDWQRKSWQEIANIKEMKQGYVSQLVRKICDLAIKHNAIIVFEDLNVGFKRGRFAIEKQVYQNLELALAKKLNYLVFKDASEGSAGHHLKAYQLTPPVQNFQDINKQCGIMFYIPASYTSAICPVCGFRKNISIPVENLDNNSKLINKFSISYDVKNDRFEFRYKRSAFYNDSKKKIKGREIKLFEDVVLQDDFVFFSDVERLKYERDKSNRGGMVKPRDVNTELKDLFARFHIEFSTNPDLSNQINVRANELDNENFYKPLIYKIALLLQLRNSKTAKNEDGTLNEKESRDFIACPSCYFHSEKELLGFDGKYIGEEKFEFNGDANGAYNIARKGALILQKLKQIKVIKGDLEKMDSTDLIITQEEWDKHVQALYAQSLKKDEKTMLNVVS